MGKKLSFLNFDLSIIKKYKPQFLIGVDEAGRGPIAGPVVACSAYVPFKSSAFLDEVRDSKILSEKQRFNLFLKMQKLGVRFGVGFCLPDEIDRINILQATFKAMKLAVCRLVSYLKITDAQKKTLVVVDGPHKIKKLDFNQIPIIDGDAKSLCIACASIFAKVIRDKWMDVLDFKYPGYGFSSHKGYGTKFHLQALRDKGPTPFHRTSFKPVKQTISTFDMGMEKVLSVCQEN